jgi:hypothetical protein
MEYIFRGYSDEAGKWVYGFYREYPIYEKCGKCIDHINYFIDDVEGKSFFVRKESVGLYTNLLDKHGKRIFSGMKVKDIRIDEDNIFEVYFNTYCAAFMIDLEDEALCSILEYIEIIDPALTKEKGDEA